MRLRALIFTLIALAGVAAAAHRLGATASAWVERATTAQVAAALADAGEDWASAEADGLIVTLTGVAPDEARRLRAAEILRGVVEPARVRDDTTLAASAPLPPPPFALELLRSEAEVSLIGLAPETAGREAIAEALAAAKLDGGVTDMLEVVAQPAPEGWQSALDFGLAALAELPRARVSVAPGRVAVTALADSDADRRAIERRLQAGRPEDVALTVEITAPLPVIAPFRVDFALDGDAGRLAACAAETDADAARIAAAAGLPATACRLGLGAPSKDWAAAASAGIAAVRELGGGGFALDDIEAVLTAPETAAPDRVAAVAATLETALPDVFSLGVVLPAPPPPAIAPPPPPPQFDAVLGEDGQVRLEGPVRDTVSRAAIESFAAALFGSDRVENATVVRDGLPDGWPGRVLTGVEALALMKEGRIEVTSEAVALEGWAETSDGADKARALFAAKAIGASVVSVRFDAQAAAVEAEVEAAVADPAGTCAAAVAEITGGATIAFEPGSATLDPSADPVIAALTSVFAGCPPVDFEIAGHTDSQGAAERNQTLSEERAETVKAALEAADLPQIGFVARGYGADLPIADNTTEAGRARNRRIEFTLIAPPGATADAAPVVERHYGPR